MLSETQNQFSVTLAGFSTCGRPKKQILISSSVISFLVVLGGALTRAWAQQPGTLDADFRAEPGAKFDCPALQSDGKIVVADRTANDALLARLNPDGSRDTSFAPNPAHWVPGLAIVVQPDDKILVAGSVPTSPLSSRPTLVRLNAEGSPDSGFHADTNALVGVAAVAIQRDSKILLGSATGGWYLIGGKVCNSIQRLNSDGALDPDFNPGTGFGNYDSWAATIGSIALQTDGRIVIGGWFKSFNGSAATNLVRLSGGGLLDTNFTAGLWTDDQGKNVICVAVQADDKVLVGGSFTSMYGVPCPGIARLNADGGLDTSFNPGAGVSGWVAAVEAIVVQPDGRILVGGAFDGFNGYVRDSMARLNLDGTLDTSFNPGTLGSGLEVYPITAQADGQILIAGRNSAGNGPVVMRLNGYWSFGPFRLSRQWPGNQMQLGFLGQPSQRYSLRTSTDLLAWDDWGESVGTGKIQWLTDSWAPTNHPQRFYRSSLIP